MSIQSEITRITSKRNDSFTAVANKGVTVPSGSTIDDLPGLIALIQTGGGGGSGGLVYQDENGYVHLSDTGGSAIGIIDTLDTNGGTIRNIYGIDLSNDTVTAADLMQGVTAHNAQGQAITGTASGGSAETLLGSGTYTVAAVASSATISTGITNSDETKPVKVLVVKDSQTSGVGQMLWWAGVYLVGPDAFVNQAGGNFVKGYFIASNGSSTGFAMSNYNTGTIICDFNRSTGEITVWQYSNNYRIQPDTYHWYVWGEAVST